MTHKYCIMIVNRTLRDIRDNDHVFNNVSIIFEDDFTQILSVMKRDNIKVIVTINIQ